MYIIGKYAFENYAPLMLVTAQISHIDHKQFVAYGIDGDEGTFRFSNAYYNKAVFKDKEKAIEEFNRRVGEDVKHG